jgi:hypothetical protein
MVRIMAPFLLSMVLLYLNRNSTLIDSPFSICIHASFDTRSNSSAGRRCFRMACSARRFVTRAPISSCRPNSAPDRESLYIPYASPTAKRIGILHRSNRNLNPCARQVDIDQASSIIPVKHSFCATTYTVLPTLFSPVSLPEPFKSLRKLIKSSLRAHALAVSRGAEMRPILSFTGRVPGR